MYLTHEELINVIDQSSDIIGFIGHLSVFQIVHQVAVQHRLLFQNHKCKFATETLNSLYVDLNLST